MILNLNLFIRNTKIAKLFLKKSLCSAIAFTILQLNGLQAQVTPMPRQDPKFVFEVNPLRNTYINPQLTSTINPRFNATLNPTFNSRIHPNSNPSINPSFEPSFNPDINPDISPRYNTRLDPKYGTRPAFFIYTTEAEPDGYAMEAIEGKLYLYFDIHMNYKGIFVYNSEGGYNLFGEDLQFTEQYLIPNSQGNFNIFNMNLEWLGFTAP